VQIVDVILWQDAYVVSETYIQIDSRDIGAVAHDD
jgi:hypothetical protein